MLMLAILIYITLWLAHLPALYITYLAIQKYGLAVEKNPTVRMIIEKWGFGASLLIGGLAKLLITLLILLAIKKFGLKVGIAIWIYAVMLFLINSVHDICEWYGIKGW